MAKKENFLYLITILTVLSLDRLTKLWALKALELKNIVVNQYLNFGLAINRGVSWSLFKSTSNFKFYLLTSIIIGIVLFFAVNTYIEYKKNKNIFFECLVISGAISNIIDRFIYSGVIDFIEFHINTWHWPIFNLADVFIFIGIIGVMGRYFYYDNVRKN